MRVFWAGSLALVFVAALSGCGAAEDNGVDAASELANGIADQFASLDEVGTGAGSAIALHDESRRTIQRLFPAPLFDRIAEAMLPSAYATSCSNASYSPCTSDARTLAFAGCNVGAATFNGTVALTWAGGSTSCTLAGNGQTLTRNPTFTITGPAGGSYQVNRTGSNGQVLTLTNDQAGVNSDVFTFTNDGIRRKLTGPNGAVLFDYTTSTLAPITVTGRSRTQRVMSGGSVRTVNNEDGSSCSVTFNSVTWNTASCRCPTAGTATGTCTNGENLSITLNGCGSATFQRGGTSRTVTFDRCFAT